MANIPDFKAMILTCPDRASVLQQTLAGLAETDWSTPPEIVLDQSDIPDRKERQVITCRRLLKLALKQPWTYLLFLEDDLEFNRHLEHNLRSWELVRRGKINLASLYQPPGIRLIAGGNRSFVADPTSVYGSQAYLLSRPCVEFLDNHFEEAPGMQDLRFVNLASRIGLIHFHEPSLVQHRPVPSVWGGIAHFAVNFDPEFKA